MTFEGKRPVPWLIGAGALLLYLATVNPWVSLLNLGTIARNSGWLWQPEVAAPLTLALLWPFRALPASWIPFALNLFTVVCAALVLVLLARCVSLLPYDIAPPKPLSRERQLSLLTIPSAWMPMVLAALLLGFQLSYWEHATSASGEMIDLLLFAYVVRCLLEFRIDQDQSWLSRSALLYAIGMVNNWAMIGYLPVYLAAVLRLKGLGPFLDRRFLFRMSFWALIGLSLYLLLPTVHLFSSSDQWGFWTTLKTHLKLQKDAISSLRNRSFRTLAMVSVLPLLVLSVRWKSHTLQFGDDTRVGVFLTKATIHFVHALFLAATLWVALDPAFSPRHLRLGMPALTFYFGAALVFGYCAGYFLLMGSGGGPRWVGQAARATVACLLGVVPLLLISKNLPQIRLTNGPALHDFAKLLYADLPAGRAVALSEEPGQSLLVRAESTQHRDKELLLVDTPSLAVPAYHRFMAAQAGARWPVLSITNKNGVLPAQQLNLVAALVSQEPVFFLHPAFGPFFEFFNEQPHGLIHQLTSTTATNAFSLDTQRVAANEEVWQSRWNDRLKTLVAEPSAAGSAKRPRSLLSRLGSVPEKNATRSFLVTEYSRALNRWGVNLERLGRWPEAGVWFQRALALNPENNFAQINSDFNTRHQNGDPARLEPAAAQAAVKEILARHGNWREALRFNGPVDEPALVIRTGRVLLAGGNERQAAREFLRAAELTPDWAAPRLWLAQAFIKLRVYDRALEQLDQAQALGEPTAAEGLAQTLNCRATALQGLGQTNQANAFIEEFVGRHRDQEEVLATAIDLYDQSKQFEKELATLDELLQKKPGQTELLVKKGATELELSRYEAAVGTLTKALATAPGNDEARLYRAVARLRAGELEAARNDYEPLLQKSVHSQNALFGLGAIAWRQHDTNAAIEFYQRYLSNGVQSSAQYMVAAERLKQLKNDPK